MKPCTPQHWSKRRIARALLLLCISAGTVAFLTGNLLIVFAFTAVFALTDWLLISIARPLNRSAFVAELCIDVQGGRSTATTNTEFPLTLNILSHRTLRDLLIVPIVPPATVAAEDAGHSGTLKEHSPFSATIKVSIKEPGETVFPGLIIRSASPLGLFTQARFLPARTSISVMPDCVSANIPAVASFMQRLHQGGGMQRRAIKNAGLDFQELRKYRYPDPLGRVDWMATARRREIIVRELQDPREFTIRIVLDASINMMRCVGCGSGFSFAAPLIGRLAMVASAQGMALTIHGYDSKFGFERRLKSGPAGVAKLLHEVISLPRAVRMRQVKIFREVHRAKAESIVRRCLGMQPFDNIHELFQQYMPVESTNGVPRDVVMDEVMADFWHCLPEYRDRCLRCGGIVYDDEASCRRCGEPMGSGDLPLRASAGANLLTRLLRSSRGREMLVFISTMTGGEVCDPMLKLLAFAAAGSRTVHIVVPMLGSLENSRPVHPGSIGQIPDRVPVLQNTLTLLQASRMAAFRSGLVDAGIRVHRLDDASDMETIVESLLLSEVLAA